MSLVNSPARRPPVAELAIVDKTYAGTTMTFVIFQMASCALARVAVL
jgi:hypothetical protein